MRWDLLFSNKYRITYKSVQHEIDMAVNHCEFSQYQFSAKESQTSICYGSLGDCKPVWSPEYKEQYDRKAKIKCQEDHDPTYSMNNIQKEAYLSIIAYKVIDQLSAFKQELPNDPHAEHLREDEIRQVTNRAKSFFIKKELKTPLNADLAMKFSCKAQNQALAQGASPDEALLFGPDDNGYQSLALDWHVPYSFIPLSGADAQTDEDENL